ncbi:hypothetical protein [Microcoleus sp. CAWBG58]|uniref:hypothetical protein n=1 Tax=Microcoleus sp. CAWBG58 TaxID=2841651 RepID=UPI0025E87DDD|nr:hypothetical protein [Microcoleus sp. CAWBG58]
MEEGSSATDFVADVTDVKELRLLPQIPILNPKFKIQNPKFKIQNSKSKIE